MGQGEFDWTEPVEEPGAEPRRKKTIDERWAEFCELHPDVLTMYRRFAIELRAAGHAKLGSKMIWERIRWERFTSAHRTELPALDNNFTSRIVRWLVEIDPSFDGYFETRSLKNGRKTED